MHATLARFSIRLFGTIRILHLERELLEIDCVRKVILTFPTNFEKSFLEDEVLPFKNGVLKNELFVSIDDDHGHEGSSLISRKQYPGRVSKKELDDIRKDKIEIFNKSFLRKIIEKIFNFLRR